MYTVLFRSQEGNDARIVGSIFDFVFAPDDYAHLFTTLFDPVRWPPCSPPIDLSVCLSISTPIRMYERPFHPPRLVTHPTPHDQATRIVSLTITEKGYCQNVDGDLDTENPGVKHDVGNLGQPRTALGMLVAALDQRRREGRGSFTVLSCDNQPDNGHQVGGIGGREGGRDGWVDVRTL